jgi:predicted phage terminase large subunit-like protein
LIEILDDRIVAKMPPQDRAKYLRLVRGIMGEPLRDFITRLTPHRPAPPHVSPIIRAMERARLGPIKVCISLPPRHVKTETVMNALAWWLKSTPTDTCAYASYNQEQAESKSRIIRERALGAGVVLKGDSASVSEWRTTAGGGLLAGKGLTGKGVQGLMVIDDLFRDAEDANSRVEREKKWEWFGSVAMTRLEGASVVMVGTRWHQDDVIGRVIAQDAERIADGLSPEWEVINLAALAEENDPLGREPGQELWPGSRYTPEYFTKLRRVIGEYIFAALYQGRPRPRGGSVFGEARYYDVATTKFDGCRLVIACDPAASEKTSSDYSAAVVLAVKGSGAETTAYVRKVYRRQSSIPELVKDLLALQKTYGNAPIHVEAVGGFKAIPQMLRALGLSRVSEIVPVGDKFTRAQPVAAAWAASRVLVPDDSPEWLGPFLDEIAHFTGVKDAHDDQVDALSHAWNVAHAKGRALTDVAW